MTRINTRSSQLRENNTNEEINYQFEEQDSLHIPDAVVNRFKNEGMTLGWLRITLKGQDDFKYIGKKMQEGWQFVELKEVPEMEQTMIVTGKPLLLNSEIIEKGSYKVIINYYDNDDLLVSVLDYDTNETLGYIDITDEDEINYNLN